MSPRRMQKAKVPLIFIVALASFFLWLLPLLFGANSSGEMLLSLIWLVALALACTSIILSDRFRARQMRTLFVADHEAFCIGCGKFDYDDHLDLLEKSILMMNNAAKNKNLPAQADDLDARYVIKTNNFNASKTQNGEASKANRTIASMEAGSLSAYDTPASASNGFFAHRPKELAVHQWTGKVESLQENASWHFSNIDELETILEQLCSGNTISNPFSPVGAAYN